MIELVVTSIRSAPAERAIAARFGPGGGTIGRLASNTLVLDDPDRTVLRMHGQVQCCGGCFFVIDQGSNPMLHNR
jgi:FHA domain-containing protein